MWIKPKIPVNDFEIPQSQDPHPETVASNYKLKVLRIVAGAFAAIAISFALLGSEATLFTATVNTLFFGTIIAFPIYIFMQYLRSPQNPVNTTSSSRMKNQETAAYSNAQFTNLSPEDREQILMANLAEQEKNLEKIRKFSPISVNYAQNLIGENLREREFFENEYHEIYSQNKKNLAEMREKLNKK